MHGFDITTSSVDELRAVLRILIDPISASKEGRLDMLKYLVEEVGAKCGDEIRNEHNQTCTLLAAGKGHLNVLKYLVDEKGASCGDNIRDRVSNTCTLLAADEGHIDVLKYLIDDKGAKYDDDIRTCTGMTCTMWAAENGHLDVLRYLVDEKEAGCGDDIRDRDGKTCAIHAAENGEMDVLRYLVYEKGIISHELLDCDLDDEIRDYIQGKLSTEEASESEGESQDEGEGEEEEKTHTITNVDLICPISQGLMTNPVVCSDGHSYQKRKLKAYIRHQQRSGLPLKSPLNPSVVLDPEIMIPNRHLKSMVLEFKKA